MPAETMEEPIDIELPKSLKATRLGAIAHLQARANEKRNALDDGTVLGLETFFTRLPGDIRAVVLTGEGAHFPPASTFPKSRARAIRSKPRFTADVAPRFRGDQFGRAPVITALHGAVVGGGLSSPLRPTSASPSARLLWPAGRAAWHLPRRRRIGAYRPPDRRRAGHGHDADRANLKRRGRPCGRRDPYLVEDGKGLETAMALAAKAASNTATTNFAVLHALPRIFESDPASGLLTDSLMAAIAEMSGEAKERLKDFLEKRAAKVVRQS